MSHIEHLMIVKCPKCATQNRITAVPGASKRYVCAHCHSSLEKEILGYTCQSCNLHVPTKYVAFYKNKGMILSHEHVEIKGYMCRQCSKKYFRDFTRSTLVLGWWSYESWVINLYFILLNIINYLSSLRIKQATLVSPE